jgi:hypothetical protein
MGVFSYSYDALHIVSPLAESPKLSDLAKHEVLLKLDLQSAGSFKIRGIGKLVQLAKAEGKVNDFLDLLLNLTRNRQSPRTPETQEWQLQRMCKKRTSLYCFSSKINA